jgi:hypothetical protein
VTQVRFSNEQYDRWAEYEALKIRRPAAAKAVADAIQVIYRDPKLAAARYSIALASDSAYKAMPFLDGEGDKTCLVWREYPDADDEIEVVDFSHPWGDLDNPPEWPRPD